jgi:hypothetical protein
MYGGNMEIIAVIGIYKKSDSFHWNYKMRSFITCTPRQT